MDSMVQSQLDNLHSGDPDRQNQAYYALLQMTEQPVDWAYAVWDVLVRDLKHNDNHVRAIAAQVLANLAKSDPEQRMLRDLDALMEGTRDERFVTARHTLQSLWKVGAAGKPQQEKLLAGLTSRFHDCASEKNCTLIRYDILQGMRNLYDQNQDERIRQQALRLIESEADEKYRKKYASLWRKP